MNLKKIIILLIAFSISSVTIGQKSYEKFVNALISGDSALAKKLSDAAVTIEPIKTRKFQIKNVPEHVFNVESNKLKDTILSFFNLDNQIDNEILSRIFYHKISKNEIDNYTFDAETNKDTLFSNEYFSKQNTSNDIFLHNFHEFWPSKYYYSQNHPLEYSSNFIIKLIRINDRSTKVLVIADDPEVINGSMKYGVHGPVARYTSVEPTTIEEYAILEFIASKLGDKTLLPLKLPSGK